MTLQLLSPASLQFTQHATTYLLRLTSPNEPLAAAASCIRGSKHALVLASSTFVRQLQPRLAPKSHEFSLPSDFLSPHFADEAFQSSQYALSCQQVGEIYSMTCAANQTNAQTECNCFVQVFGKLGYIEIGTHDGVVRNHVKWSSCVDIITHALVVDKGSLRKGVLPEGYDSSAIVTVSAAGKVRFASARSFSAVQGKKGWQTGSWDIAEICQTAVLVTCDAASEFVVIVGCGRGGGVMHYAGSTVGWKSFVLPGEGRLNRYDLHVVECENGWVVIEEAQTGHRISIKCNEGDVDVNRDYENRLTRFGKKDEGDVSWGLKQLMRGIEELGEWEGEYEAAGERLERSISSFNNALLFVSEWKERERVRKELEEGCSISVERIGGGGMSLPAPMLGIEVFVKVKVRNCTGIALGEGWMVDVTLQEYSSPWVKSGGMVVPKREETTQRVRRKRVMTSGLGYVAAGDVKEVCLPFVLDSHRSLQVSAKLVFYHACLFARGNDGASVEVGLVEDVVLDILSFSQITKEKEVRDSSHLLLGCSQLAQLFKEQDAENYCKYALVSRFDLPFPPDKIRKVVGVTNETTVFKSALGGEFSISVGLREEQDGVATSAVSVRGAAHVLPFVRGAILRRALKLTDDMKGITIRSTENVNRWQKMLLNAGEESMTSFRKAESLLVEGLRMIRQIEDGDIEHCWDAQEREALVQTLQSAKSCYADWRRQIEQMWTPKGAVAPGAQV